MQACSHIVGAGLRPPSAAQSVHREDCTQCFDSIDDPAGLNVCLSCFNGGCAFSERNHAGLHYQLTQHPLVVNIKRTKKKRKERDEPPKKISKLAIDAETEEDIYDTTTTVHCYGCGGAEVPVTSSIQPVVDGVMSAMTSARQNEVKAWEQEITPCEHTLCLQQEAAKQLESQALAHCSQCDLKENLWLCLQCGSLGCGRAQFGGVGGNGHALAHYEAVHHPVAVKLGSITPEGTADIYCYACNDERTDPELAKHLAHWGINIAERQKTEKSLTELNVEQNLRWEFSMTTEDGKELKPLFGAGLTGLKNLGNSCYLNSILQCLFSLDGFKNRYFLGPDGEMPLLADPAEDLETQLRKVADGLLSGRYAKPDTDVISSEYSAEIPHQKGLRPAMLKTLIGRGHEEFSTMRQQDAFELLLHLFKLITRSKHTDKLNDPVDDFRFVLEQRLQCLGCKKVSYRSDVQDNISVPVPVRRTKESEFKEMDVENKQGKEKELFEPVTLKECLDIFTGPETIEYTCKGCGGKDGAVKRSLFKTFPKVLAVNCRRFELINWVPTKLDIPVVVGDEPFFLDSYRSEGLQPGEELLPEDSDNSGSQPSFVPNPEAMGQLEAMGFPVPRCEKALYHTGNVNAEDAMNWLFGHMEDPDIDEPLNLGGKGNDAASASPEHVEQLTGMGFSAQQAKKALKSTENNVERAVEWLFSHPDDLGEDDSAVETSSAPSKAEPGNADLPAEYELDSIVCHKGGSIHAGHYVAFVKKHLPEDDNKSRSWVLFNDEKVVKAVDVDEMKKFAYVYFFKRNTMSLGA
ncbi:ubiquitinyl hydrolase [Ascobolus immersus RN42]|uniref:Ubiquitin carboxyl-terminal hydrolase n=1 Tax=Ascobolus immersus RN42 TaxID=1160509 RepID=A0A3N4I6D0_ASCIM|nr:ubiquitinyl hydrolase [Ascobolus immersus RN42]